MHKQHALVRDILAQADIQINGTRPWDIVVKNERFYDRLIADGSLGFGESYMDGDWECTAIDELIERIFQADLYHKAPKNMSTLWFLLLAKLTNRQNKKRAFQVGEEHYDLGNDVYRAMLDPRMVYTCAYFKEASDLAVAQEQKLDLICRKIGLKAGDHVLDIGCGWGSFAKFAAEKYGATVTGVTVSQEQIELGKELCAGLPVNFLLSDYRDITGTYDHIVSIGMFEHVGVKNYETFFEVASRCLKDDGLFLLHTIGNKKPAFATDPWIDKYIFPNGIIPALSQISIAAEKQFIIEDVHNFSYDYYRTLKAWHKNFMAAWPELSSSYSERFKRMWEYYLLVCAGGFKARKLQLFQLVLSKKGVPRGYTSVR